MDNVILAALGWQDIKTAPKDGSPVKLGLLDHNGDFWKAEGQFWLKADEHQSGMWSTDPYWGDPPTHWKPQ